jgi:hypothetical protein
MAELTKTAGVICGCVLGFTIGVEMGEPSGAGAAPGLRLTVVQAQAASFKVRKILENKKKQEAEEKAARKKEGAAERARLKGTRTKELPPACAYDLQASQTLGSEVYQCDGKLYQAIKDGDFEGYEAHPVGMDREAIDKERERRAKATAKRKAAAKKKRQAGRVSELPPSCVYDANASVGYSTDIYSCGNVLYRPYEEKNERGFEVVRPAGQGGGQASTPARSAGNGGGSTY